MISKTATVVCEKDTSEKPLIIYSKQVKEDLIEHQVVERVYDKELVNNLVNSLKANGKSRKFQEFDLSTNCKAWINTILDAFPANEVYEYSVRFLLNDFSSAMNTRMRESDKYAIAILEPESLLICHARMGEKTLTPLYEVVDRMLDRDNVERFVIFQKHNENLNVIYYENSPSVFFTQWLGIPDRDAYYYHGGNNRIFGQLDGLKVILELTDDEVETKLLKGDSPVKIENNQIVFNTAISRLPINQIRIGKKHFASANQFYQDYLARRYQLKYYQDRYKEIIQSIDPLLHAYIDCECNVIKYEEESEVIIVTKHNPNFLILFSGLVSSVDRFIKIDEEFLNTIYANFENQVNMRIFHAGMELYPQDSEPTKIGSLSIYNKVSYFNCISPLLDLYTEGQLIDEILKDSLNYSIFKLLAEANRNFPISYLFDKLSDKIGEKIQKPHRVSQNESAIVEFKSASELEGSDTDIATRLSADLTKKLGRSPFKIYFFGVEDDTKQVSPIPSRRINSDRLGHIESLLLQTISLPIHLHIVKIPINDLECLVLLMACES